MDKKIKDIFKNNNYLLEEDDVNKLISLYEEQKKEIEELNFDIFEKKTSKKYSIENELSEFIRDLYISCEDFLEEPKNRFDEKKKISSEDMLKNIKKYIEEFARNNNFRIKI